MRIGFGIPVAGAWSTPAAVREVCRRAEELGYASLWSFQRTLYPGNIPVVYRSVQDPLAVSAFVAGVTERARIGIAVVNMPFYAPLVLAKALTSIDVLSDGRLDAGLGNGWNADEFRAAGVPIEGRGKRAEEFLAALDAIWSGRPHLGVLYVVPPGVVLPRPVQQPRPQLLLGGSAEPALLRAARLTDGWISSSMFPEEKVAGAVATLRSVNPDARAVVRAVVRVREQDEERPFSGTVDKVRADIARYAGYGVTELFVDLNFDEQIGDPDADVPATLRRAHAALEAFAP
jgi:alkanesulfonate monooxygenase SsuD/methylene tetrahydromethanopterin reductase-like flavin-dependent oxidoreductase (luciferase family)